MVALQIADALVAQQRRFLGGLDAFGDGAEPETPGQTEQMAQNHPVLAAIGEAADKRAVDLDGIDRQHLKMPQRGMAGAKIVERDAAAGMAQGLDKAGRFVEVVERRGLGDLDDQAVRPVRVACAAAPSSERSHGRSQAVSPETLKPSLTPGWAASSANARPRT